MWHEDKQGEGLSPVHVRLMEGEAPEDRNSKQETFATSALSSSCTV